MSAWLPPSKAGRVHERPQHVAGRPSFPGRPFQPHGLIRTESEKSLVETMDRYLVQAVSVDGVAGGAGAMESPRPADATNAPALPAGPDARLRSRDDAREDTRESPLGPLSGTRSSGARARLTTCAATLPAQNASVPVLPCVPMTTRSAVSLRAAFAMARAGSPVKSRFPPAPPSAAAPSPGRQGTPGRSRYPFPASRVLRPAGAGTTRLDPGQLSDRRHHHEEVEVQWKARARSLPPASPFHARDPRRNGSENGAPVSARSLAPRVRGGTHHEHGRLSPRNDLLGDCPENEPPRSPPAVHAHDDEVGGELRGVLRYAVRDVSAPRRCGRGWPRGRPRASRGRTLRPGRSAPRPRTQRCLSL